MTKYVAFLGGIERRRSSRHDGPPASGVRGARLRRREHVHRQRQRALRSDGFARRRWSRRSRRGSPSNSATPCRRSCAPRAWSAKASALEPYGAIAAGDTHYVAVPPQGARRGGEASHRNAEQRSGPVRGARHGTAPAHPRRAHRLERQELGAGQGARKPYTCRNAKSLRKLVAGLANMTMVSADLVEPLTSAARLDRRRRRRDRRATGGTAWSS